ncbi:hypothetical protein RUM44_001736 [Polyplax serrata]|uniref:C2H2-type domain-containing protein n=1 Tax=Polyplax serrata TaxID=468196 RepID=A0ABR1AKU9_POLSC
MVISVGLPLLIVGGKFHNINCIKVEDLETFIPFMTRCSINRAGASMTSGIPEWWTSSIKFKFPLQRPPELSEFHYCNQLRAIVCSCYWYHNAQYLLQFSAKIAENPDSVFLQTNSDGTTSILQVHNNVQILRFSNENVNYDAKPRKTQKPIRRSLLSSLFHKKYIPDIYLCDNCDAEFSSLSEVRKHEKDCYEIILIDDEDSSNHSNIGCEETTEEIDEAGQEECPDLNDSREDIQILDHIKPETIAKQRKEHLLSYVGLQKNENIGNNLSTPKKLKCTCSRPRSLGFQKCLHKDRNIEFSSKFGRKIFENLLNKSAKNILYYEPFCRTNLKTFKITKPVPYFRPSFRKAKRPNLHHQYTFGRRQRIDNHERLKRGFSIRTWKLLKLCKEVKIVLERVKVPSEKYG